jgi:hypothetical protein
LWQRIEHHFPEPPEPGTRGLPPAPARAVLNRI